jgi:hypothetical protein
LGEIFVDNDHGLATRSIVGRERAARNEGHPHHLQVPWCHSVAVDALGLTVNLDD